MQSNYDPKKKEMKKICADIFTDTYNQCKTNILLKESINFSIKSTKLYLEGNKFILDKTPIKSKEYNIIITPDRTLDCVYKYYLNINKNKNNPYKIGVLNFASAKHPGGGVTRGARAQEESICRASTLYPCLNTDFLKDNYYSYHMNKVKEYSNRIIYIPNIIVFKSDEDIFSKILTEDKWYNIDIISCAAHNQKAYKLSYEKLKELNYNKIKAIIDCAVENNIDILILGAFGCGAFGNDPKLVSKIFKKILIDEKYFEYFFKVHFAIFSMPYETKNLNEFQNTFDKYIKKI